MATITVPICCQSRNLPIVTASAVTICLLAWTMFGDTDAPSKRTLGLNATEVALVAAMARPSGSPMGVRPGRSDVYAFAALICLLGIAFAFGTASTSKSISNDYLGMIGTGITIVGLSGFVVPVMFSALMDRTGIGSSAFMPMCGVIWVWLIWMHWTEERRNERRASAPTNSISPAEQAPRSGPERQTP